ncbi:hypothetical protein [Nannocystis pusilla]|uniref:hypothetical protein n=1 Tax=Nannocystis pusilla TaxID=889268 RepID=UPI003DA596D5
MGIEGTMGLRAAELWHAWGRILAGGGDDLGALLAATSLRVTANKPITRLRLGLSQSSPGGQVVLELRIDFKGATKVELELDGVVYDKESTLSGDRSDAWCRAYFGGKFVEFRVVHENVPELMDAVYARSEFMPELPALAEVARISWLQVGVDAALGAAQRVHFQLRHGIDARAAFAGMDFLPCHADGTPYTDADEDKYRERRGPDAGLPRGVAWRRGDAILTAEHATFGAHARKILLL